MITKVRLTKWGLGADMLSYVFRWLLVVFSMDCVLLLFPWCCLHVLCSFMCLMYFIYCIIHRCAYLFVYSCMYLSMCMSLCMSLCVCLCAPCARRWVPSTLRKHLEHIVVCSVQCAHCTRTHAHVRSENKHADEKHQRPTQKKHHQQSFETRDKSTISNKQY